MQKCTGKVEKFKIEVWLVYTDIYESLLLVGDYQLNIKFYIAWLELGYKSKLRQLANYANKLITPSKLRQQMAQITQIIISTPLI